MAAPNEQQWSQYEKNYLLAEIIKLNNPSPSVLLGVIAQFNMSLDWNNVVLPPGRSLNQCLAAYEEITRATAPTVYRTSFGPQTPSPMTSQMPANLKRPFPYETTASTARRLEPKPASVGGARAQSSIVEQPPKKKRGRPPKTEIRLKLEQQPPSGFAASRAQSMSGPSMVASSVSQPLENLPPVYPPVSEPPRPIPQPAGRMQLSSILTPTAPASASHSSSSSGKRRRGRSSRSEPEEYLRTGDEAGSSMRQSGQYESPYQGVALPSVDSPARTAQMRHRDEQSSEAQQREGPERSAQSQQPPYPPDSGQR